jgi:polysaccharide biosynthesis/export protein
MKRFLYSAGLVSVLAFGASVAVNAQGQTTNTIRPARGNNTNAAQTQGRNGSTGTANTNPGAITNANHGTEQNPTVNNPDSATNSVPSGAAIRTTVSTPTNSPEARRSASVTPATTTSSTPNNTANLPPTSVYRVGVGDVLDIRLLNVQTRQSTLYTIMAGGLLEYPLVGDPVQVVNLTTDEIAARLIEELRRRQVFAQPQVSVAVREYVSHTVTVSGLVANAGTRVLRREAVPLYVVLAESQPRPEAGRATITRRSTGENMTIDLSDTAGMNTLVNPGDVIAVQNRLPQFFYIGGQVGAPGQKDYHSGMTLTQAIFASGGATRFANARVRIMRQGADGRLVTTEYNLREIEEGRIPDPLIQPGDRIELGRSRW